MENKDYMIRAIAADRQLRAFAITSQGVVEAARRAHNTSPLASAALGRTMSGALMMSDMLKNDKDLITLQFDGDGPLGRIVVTADTKGTVKGYVTNPNVDLPLKPDGHLNVGAGVGKGTLTVIRDLDMKTAYNGQIEIYSGEIAEDLTHYFAESEQIPSSVGLGVLVDTDCTIRRAGGFIIQLMPFAEDETITKLENNLKEVGFVTEMLEEGLTPETMLGRVLKGFDLEITETIPVKFQCNCSRDRVERALMLIGKKDLTEMIDEGNDIELGCQFCGKKYSFTPADLMKIREAAK